MTLTSMSALVGFGSPMYFYEPSPISLNWYRSLPLHTRINVPEMFELACGADWQQVGKLLSMRERIQILYDKLDMMGIINQ